MNRIKKAAFGVLVAGLAFGFSAFTTFKGQSIFVYYKTNLTYDGADDPRGYEHYSEDRCVQGGTICSAKWDIGNNPFPNDGDVLPTGAIFQNDTTVGGHFE